MLILSLSLICVHGCLSAPASDTYCLADQELRLSEGGIERLNNADVEIIYLHNCRWLAVCDPEAYKEVCQ